LLALVALVAVPACSSSSDAGQTPDTTPGNPTVQATAIFAHAESDQVVNCTSALCRHNENTDLIRWNGAIYMVHRTAVGQVLGPNSSLRIFRSTDEGQTFALTAVIPAPQGPLSADDQGAKGRDIRDPCFYIAGDRLYIKALARLPVASTRDSDVDTRTLYVSTADGTAFSPWAQMAPGGFSFWRIKKQGDTYYAAAYADGDAANTLFTSPDGVTWTQGTTFYSNAADTPLEPEVVFLPSGKMLVYFRMDGDDNHLIGTSDLHTRVCWSDAPYTSFDCSQQITGQRLDGPVDFLVGNRLFIVARKHLGESGRKRTALFEVTGNLEGGPIDVVERAEFPSAGDTAYASVVPLANGHWLTTWYSSDITDDLPWALALAEGTDIWRGEIVFP
jgi:hypothetical protein